MNKTKEGIFKAAIKIFSCSGYDGATMDDIAFNAGVSKGTLYYYFKSKEEIFRCSILEGMNLIKNNMEKTIQGTEKPIDKLMSLYKNQVAILCKNKDFFNVIMSQVWGHEHRQEELREVMKNYINEIQKSLKIAMDAGVMKRGETKFLAYSFFGILCSEAVYKLLNDDENEDIDTVIENITKYILCGIIN